MKNDDGKRSRFGVVVTLLDLGNGKTRVSIDDVKSGSDQRNTQWSFDLFYTHNELDTKAVDAMELAGNEYEGLGAAIMARLLALNGRVTNLDGNPDSGHS